MAVNKLVPKISVNVIARNEEDDIGDCLKSARLLADEIVFVDMESSDQTKKIAQKLADKVYSHPQTG
jgi:glycosyltransferase involved in cell wall biosynthesis